MLGSCMSLRLSIDSCGRAQRAGSRRTKLPTSTVRRSLCCRASGPLRGGWARRRPQDNRRHARRYPWGITVRMRTVILHKFARLSAPRFWARGARRACLLSCAGSARRLGAAEIEFSGGQDNHPHAGRYPRGITVAMRVVILCPRLICARSKCCGENRHGLCRHRYVCFPDRVE